MFFKNLRYGTDYPKQCPPNDCKIASSEVLYRACHAEVEDSDGNLNMENFIPVWEQTKTTGRTFPKPKFCEAKALSFFSTEEACLNKIRDYPKIGSKIIKVKLNSQCGFIRKSDPDSLHYSLWDLSKPTISKAIGKNWKKVYG